MNKIKTLFRAHPFIGWNIVGLLSAFIHPAIWLIFFVVSLVFFAKRRKEIKEEKRKTLIVEAEAYVVEIKKNHALPKVASSIFLNNGENAFLQEETKLNETRAVRKQIGGGAGFRVAKGVYLGGYSGQAESHQEWRTLDIGQLIITNKKLIFKGRKENRVIPLDTIFALETFSDGIEISLESRAKSIIFPVKNPYIWSAVIHILRTAKNPLNLAGINLDISFR